MRIDLEDNRLAPYHVIVFSDTDGKLCVLDSDQLFVDMLKRAGVKISEEGYYYYGPYTRSNEKEKLELDKDTTVVSINDVDSVDILKTILATYALAE